MKEGLRFHFLVLVAVFLLAATGAHAGAYVGVSAGQSNTEISDPSGSFNAGDTGFKIFGGYRFMKFFGLEADYRDLGSAEDDVLGTTLAVDTKSLDLFAVGVLPLGAFEVFGKAGYASWDASLYVPGQQGSFDDDGTDLAYGIGAAYKISKIAVRLEYELFEVEDLDNLSMATVGVDFRF